MSTAEAPIELITRPKRADARRNDEKVLAAARDAFAAGGEATSLEEIARRAEVGDRHALPPLPESPGTRRGALHQ
jgi:hypothetical protein